MASLNADAAGMGAVPEPGPRLRSYVHWLRRWRRVMLLFWLLCLGVGLWQGPKLLAATQLSITAPPGSEAAIATGQLKQYFPVLANTSALVVLLKRLDNTSSLGPDTAGFTHDLADELAAKYNASAQTAGGLQANVTGYYTIVPGNGTEPPAGIVNKTLADLAKKELVCGLAACNESETIIAIAINAASLTPHSRQFVADLEQYSADLQAKWFDSRTSVRITGELVFGVDVSKGSEKDLLMMDSIAFPLAMTMLAMVLRSFRLLLVPIVCIATSILTSFLIMYPVALHYEVVSFAPSIMMSATIAMSIDYSLFMLSRFREELLAGRPVPEAVLQMTWTAGHTISVSGLTLALCFFGLMFFPVSFLRTPGMGAGIAILITLIVNLTLAPALLLTFPNFFARCIKAFPCCKGKNDGQSKTEEAEWAPLLQSGDQPATSEWSVLKGRGWFRFGRFLLKLPVSALLVIGVTALAVPCAVRALNFERTVSLLAATPRNANSTLAFADIQAEFGAGALFPYRLVAVPPAGVSALDATTVQAVQQLAANLSALPSKGAGAGLRNLTIAGAFWIDSHPIDWEVIWGLTFGCRDQGINFGSPASCADESLNATTVCRDACRLVAPFVSECGAGADPSTCAGNATYVEVQLPGDPFSLSGLDWLRGARAALANASAATNVSFYLAEGAADGEDMQAKVYGMFPAAIGGTAGIVLLLVGGAFRSVVIPVRAIFSITLTLAFVYGSAVWVYQCGALDGLHFAGMHGHGALSWISPVMCFSILVGLGLDYDIFLLSRIVEYRHAGFSDYHSILYGVTRTGGIITAAGLVMAIAFAGLLFSSEPILNELSFYFVLAVLVDTFVIRSLVVPALMRLLGPYNYLPSKVPAPHRDLYEPAGDGCGCYSPPSRA